MNAQLGRICRRLAVLSVGTYLPASLIVCGWLALIGIRPLAFCLQGAAVAVLLPTLVYILALSAFTVTARLSLCEVPILPAVFLGAILSAAGGGFCVLAMVVIGIAGYVSQSLG